MLRVSRRLIKLNEECLRTWSIDELFAMMRSGLAERIWDWMIGFLVPLTVLFKHL